MVSGMSEIFHLRESDELPWMPVSPGFDLKVLHGTVDDDTRALLLRVQPGTVVGLHRHSAEVHGFNLSGQRKLLETGEVIGPGGYVYEPPGNVDSWMAVGEEPLLTVVTVRGSVEDLDEHGKVTTTTTTSSIAESYRRFVAAHPGTTKPATSSVFASEAIAPETRAANEAFRKATAGGPKWWDVGAAAYRAAAATGKGAFPRPEKSQRARTLSIEGKGGHAIALRVIAPERPQGIHLFMHGGGMVFGAVDVQDPMLERIADRTGMACVSVDYRLAPEHPYPAAWDDCESAATWLVKHAKSELGSDVLTLGGESAGATLAVATLIRLRDRHDYTRVRAVSLAYGNYDASMTPSQSLAPDEGSPISFVGKTSLRKFVEAYLPAGVNPRDPDVSPLYADVHRMPPALFTVGTIDPLLDDSLFLHARWIAAGNDAELAVYPGASHAFNSLPMPQGAAADARIARFLKGAII
jgi:acetyl esterase